MTRDDQRFDDPALKLALRGLYGARRARPELRDAVVAAMRQADAPSSPRGSLKLTTEGILLTLRRRWLRPVIAAAAVLAVALGVNMYAQYERGAPQRKLYADNAAIVQRMTVIHDAGATTSEGTALSSPLSDPDALAAEASQALGRTVPAPRLAGGWTLDAASICDVLHVKAARFHFVNAGRSLTLLSMPANVWYGDKGATGYSLVVESHPIAGYPAAGSLNCVVGDRAMPLAESERLRDLLRRG